VTSGEWFVSIATGRRPVTAHLALRCYFHQYPEMAERTTVVRWAETCDLEGWDVLDLPGANRAQAHNEAYKRHHARHGPPHVWFTMDDDVVLPTPEGFRGGSAHPVFQRLERMLDGVRSLGLLGAVNEGSYIEPGSRPWRQRGEEFHLVPVVGGAFTAIPFRTTQGVGLLDEGVPGMEDTEYSERVRANGMDVAVATTIQVVLLRDDGIDPSYVPDKWATYRATAQRWLDVRSVGRSG